MYNCCSSTLDARRLEALLREAKTAAARACEAAKTAECAAEVAREAAHCAEVAAEKVACMINEYTERADQCCCHQTRNYDCCD